MTERPEESRAWLWTWYRPFELGGVGAFVASMAGEARRNGVRPVVAALCSVEGPLREEATAQGLEVLDWTSFWGAFRGASDPTDVLGHVAEDLCSLRPEAFFVNDCTDFGCAMSPLLGRIGECCPVIDIIHVDPPGTTHLESKRRYFRALHAIVSTSPVALEKLRRLYPGSSRIPQIYIPYGSEVSSLARSATEADLRILVVSRLVQEQKRILDLPSVLLRLVRHGCAFHVTIVGEGPDRGELERRIWQVGLEDRVTFRGFLTPREVIPLYRQHEVLLNISAYEGFPITVVEALRAGCVPFCTRVPSLDEELLRDGQNCRLVPVEQPERVADALAAVTRPELSRMSRSAEESGFGLTYQATFMRYERLVASLQKPSNRSGWADVRPEVLSRGWAFTSASALARETGSARGRVLSGVGKLLGRARKHQL